MISLKKKLVKLLNEQMTKIILIEDRYLVAVKFKKFFTPTKIYSSTKGEKYLWMFDGKSWKKIRKLNYD